MDIKVPPLNVSPLIKATRWSLLIIGIFWGNARLKMIRNKELPIRLENKKRRAEELARRIEEKKIRGKQEEKEIFSLLGVD